MRRGPRWRSVRRIFVHVTAAALSALAGALAALLCGSALAAFNHGAASGEAVARFVGTALPMVGLVYLAGALVLGPLAGLGLRRLGRDGPLATAASGAVLAGALAWAAMLFEAELLILTAAGAGGAVAGLTYRGVLASLAVRPRPAPPS